ncbi:MAG: hypothetical protein ACWGNV_10170 [Bacteroidales bacterium]
MENHYLCPHCRGQLKVGDYIIFRIKNAQREKGLLLLHPEIGNYSSIKHPQIQLMEGDRIDFFCPICFQSLDTSIDENLVHVLMIDQDHKEHKIYFSRIAGEKSTYQVSDEGVHATGEHSYRYTHFKMSDRFIKYLKG